MKRKKELILEQLNDLLKIKAGWLKHKDNNDFAYKLQMSSLDYRGKLLRDELKRYD